MVFTEIILGSFAIGYAAIAVPSLVEYNRCSRAFKHASKDYPLQRWFRPSLRRPSVAVTNFDDIAKLNYELIKTMNAYSAGGVSAPQLGVNKRVIVAEINGIPKTFVNPQIRESSGRTLSLEGCWSFPGVIVLKERKKLVAVDYQTIFGEEKYGVFKGMSAFILQHEIYHLDGKTIFS